MIHHFTYFDDVILIKPFCLDDAGKQLRGEDDEIRKWLNEGQVSTLESVTNWIQSWQDDGTVFPFAIWTIEDKTLVGMVEARTHWQTIEGLEDGDANISYCLYPDYRGKGYVTRAIKLIQGFLTTKGIKRAVIRISPDNVNSLKVPPRCGFQKTGQVRTESGEVSIIFVREIQ
jgi:RimJ/RimL family protein N-acetyltransferase